MHHIYHTEGIVLGSKNFGEAGKRYFIFTRDMGMISALAQGVRKVSSKLRFVLQDFAYIKIDLVRGKDFWRITNASKTNRLEGLLRPGVFRIFADISKLLQRLLAGEDQNSELFADLVRGLSVLEKSGTKEELSNAEAVIVLRVLHKLGYMGSDAELDGLLKSPLDKSLVSEAGKNRSKILRRINASLKETHL